MGQVVCEIVVVLSSLASSTGLRSGIGSEDVVDAVVVDVVVDVHLLKRVAQVAWKSLFVEAGGARLWSKE